MVKTLQRVTTLYQWKVSQFGSSLDVPENIVALCQIATEQFTTQLERFSKMIKQLFHNRKESLELRGLVLK